MPNHTPPTVGDKPSKPMRLFPYFRTPPSGGRRRLAADYASFGWLARLTYRLMLWRFPMKRTILVSLATVLIFGCGKPGTDEPTFEKVEVQRILPQNAKATATVTDRATVAKLVTYFPNMGQG